MFIPKILKTLDTCAIINNISPSLLSVYVGDSVPGCGTYIVPSTYKFADTAELTGQFPDEVGSEQSTFSLSKWLDRDVNTSLMQ